MAKRKAKPKTKRPSFDIVAHLLSRARMKLESLERLHSLAPPLAPGEKPSTLARFTALELDMAKDEVRTMELLPEELAKATDQDDPQQFGAAIDRAWLRVIEERDRERQA